MDLRIPIEQCRNDTLDYECIGSREFEQAYAGKQIVMLSNRKRFN